MDIENNEELTFPFEVKSLDDKGAFVGYAAIFDTPDMLDEVIERGAFAKTLKENKQYPLLWYHVPQDVIGTAEVEEDSRGLKVTGQLNLDVQLAREKYSLMKQKAIKGLSFGFKTIKEKMQGAIRILQELKLYEVSPVTFGAHPDALISAVKSRESGGSPFSPILESLAVQPFVYPSLFESTIDILKGKNG